jgi:hypothetical protein
VVPESNANCITDPSDPEAVIVPSAAPLQDTFVALADGYFDWH